MPSLPRPVLSHGASQVNARTMGTAVNALRFGLKFPPVVSAPDSIVQPMRRRHTSLASALRPYRLAAESGSRRVALVRSPARLWSVDLGAPYPPFEENNFDKTVDDVPSSPLDVPMAFPQTPGNREFSCSDTESSSSSADTTDIDTVTAHSHSSSERRNRLWIGGMAHDSPRDFDDI